jgi:fatty-acyl-CoA synthase
VLCFPVLARGGEIVIMRAPDVGQFIANIEGSSLPCFWYGAAPMSVARLEEALSRIAPVMAQLFGQTEAPMRVVAVVQPARSKVGKILKTEIKGRQS